MTEWKAPKLGDRVEDTVTGVKGIVVCVTTWLHGCIRLGVQSEKADKDGKAQEPQYFDQSQISVVKEAIHQPLTLGLQPTPPAETRRSAGGPSRESAAFRR